MRKISKVTIWVFKFCLVGGVIAYLVLSGKLNFGILLDIRPASLWLSGVAILLIAVVFGLSFLRFWLLLFGNGIHLTLRSVCRIGMIGMFFNTFMFGGTGGDVIKVLYISRASQNRAGTIAATLLDRVIGLCSLLLIGEVAILISYPTISGIKTLHLLAITTNALLSCALVSAFCGFLTVLYSSRHGWLSLATVVLFFGFLGWSLLGLSFSEAGFSLPSSGDYLSIGLVSGWVLAVVFAALAVVLLPGCLPGGWLDAWVRRRLPLGTHLMHFIESLLLYRHHLKVLFGAFALSSIMHILNLGALLCCARMLPLDPQPRISHIVFAAPMTLLANALPLPGGAAGVGEAAFENLLRLCIVGGQAVTGGAMIFLLYRLCTILMSLCGMPFYLKNTQSRPCDDSLSDTLHTPLLPTNEKKELI